jgi:glycine/D-amino acid oxidase-like deaminating enzyme
MNERRVRINRSPWLHQLDAKRVPVRLAKDIGADVAIIGAGIAGVASAFFALKYTSKKVVVIEGNKLAHGATGRNAGQVVSYFERGFASMVEEFGLKMAAEGEKAIDDAWELLDEMYTDAGLNIPFSRFMGHGGLSSYEQVVWHLKNNKLRRDAGRPVRRLVVADSAPFARDIPAEYEGLYFLVSRDEVRSLLETELDEFVAVISHQKGCINSALFCQEVVAYLAGKYSERFALFEHTPVRKVVLKNGHALLDADAHTVTARHVVLCTNGFENIHILNETGLDIDARYHHLVSGKIGYMSGYLEAMNKPPVAISYYTDPIASIENSYYYLTRRPYEYEEGTKHNLICIGGPDADIEESASYSHEDEYPEEAAEQIDAFLHRVYDLDPNKKIDFLFTWHGLMGYTRNGIRLVGPEPQNPVLLYNLGCNGVGILPSLHGGRKVARFLAGEELPKSMFDVPRR